MFTIVASSTTISCATPNSANMQPRRRATSPKELVRLMFAVAAAYGEATREHGLTGQQARLLCAAGRLPTAGIGDLATLMTCDRSNVSRLVERIEERGLVARKGTETDGRVTVVALTEDGHHVVDRFTETLESRFKALTADWPDGERQATVGLLSRLTESLNREPEPEPAERVGAHLLPAG